MDLPTWLSQNLGKGATPSNHLTPYPPHSILGQCVTAGSSWSMAQGGPELLGTTAWEIWQLFRNPFFSVIPYAAHLSPQVGDIVFYYPNNPAAGTGDAGHVDICTGNITPSGFQGADMDWNGNGNLQYVNHQYNGVAGWFHHEGDLEMTDEVRAVLADIKQWELNISAAIAQLASSVALLQKAVYGDKVPETPISLQLPDIKQWELNVDQDVKGGQKPSQ